MARYLLVTNDYPPKLGGIQNYLWELWRRLPPEEVCVFTRTHPGDTDFDAQQQHRIMRSAQPFLLPTPSVAYKVRALVADLGTELVMYDPAVPLGAVAPKLPHRYGVFLHGAEVTVPGHLPGARRALRNVLRGAALVVAAGEYSIAEAERAAGMRLPTVAIPPGVDADRFTPLSPSERAAVRASFGVRGDAPVVLSVSRLVPRKGMDVLIEACARLAQRHPGLQLLIAGSGRDHARLERLILRSGAPARLLERVGDTHLPALYASADVFAMLCRNRWHGLEQEGFGIVFLEAAAAGVPQIAGASGGAAEAVTDGYSGLVVDNPSDVTAVATALDALLGDEARRRTLGEQARRRAVGEFSYDGLAERLHEALERTLRQSEATGGADRDR